MWEGGHESNGNYLPGRSRDRLFRSCKKSIGRSLRHTLNWLGSPSELMNAWSVSSHAPRSAKYLIWSSVKEGASKLIHIQKSTKNGDYHNHEKRDGEESMLRSPYGEVHNLDSSMEVNLLLDRQKDIWETHRSIVWVYLNGRNTLSKRNIRRIEKRKRIDWGTLLSEEPDSAKELTVSCWSNNSI